MEENKAAAHKVSSALSPMATPPMKWGDEFGPLLGNTLKSIHGGISHLLGLILMKFSHLLDGPHILKLSFFFFLLNLKGTLILLAFAFNICPPLRWY